MRISSNQMPTLAMLATSCLVSVARCSGVIASQMSRAVEAAAARGLVEHVGGLRRVPVDLGLRVEGELRGGAEQPVSGALALRELERCVEVAVVIASY